MELVWKLLANSIPGLLGRTNKTPIQMIYHSCWPMYSVSINHSITTLVSISLDQIRFYLEQKGAILWCGMTDSCCIGLPPLSPSPGSGSSPGSSSNSGSASYMEMLTEYQKMATSLAEEITSIVLKNRLKFVLEGLTLGFLGISETEYACLLLSSELHISLDSLQKNLKIKAPGLLKNDQPKITQKMLFEILTILFINPSSQHHDDQILLSFLDLCSLLFNSQEKKSQEILQKKLETICNLISQTSIQFMENKMDPKSFILRYAIEPHHLKESFSSNSSLEFSQTKNAILLLNETILSGSPIDPNENTDVQSGERMKLIKITKNLPSMAILATKTPKISKILSNPRTLLPYILVSPYLETLENENKNKNKHSNEIKVDLNYYFHKKWSPPILRILRSLDGFKTESGEKLATLAFASSQKTKFDWGFTKTQKLKTLKLKT
jgi:DNA polymerase elongation subunit (family B)